MSGDLALPRDYDRLLAELKERVRGAQIAARRAVNTELLRLYWSIGTLFALVRSRLGGGHGGARAVEGYPIDTADRGLQPGDLYYGTLQAFGDAGFELVERRGVRRALVRRTF